jgi:hypothetical protein
MKHLSKLGMRKHFLVIILGLFFYSYTSANPPKDSLIDFSFGFHNDYKKSIDVKILNEQGISVFNFTSNDRIGLITPQQSFTKRGYYTICIQDPSNDRTIRQSLYLDPSLVSVEINVALLNSSTDIRNIIYVYKHYKNDLGLSLKPVWNSKEASTFKSHSIPNFILTNTQDSIVYGIRYHFSPNLSSPRAKLDHTTYPYMMVYKDSKWTALDCAPPDVLMNLKKGEKGIMKTSLYSNCTNKDFDKNNLYQLVVPYGINNRIEEKIATNFFYTEQKIYTVAEEFIFAKPRIKLKS